MSDADDRTFHVPEHRGPNILPSHSLFFRLLRLAHQTPARLCIRDDNAGVEATHIQLLSDVLALRTRLHESMSDEARQALRDHQEVYIAVLAPGGYEYAVAMLAALATGAAVVPLTVVIPPEEAFYFANKARCVSVLASSGALKLGLELEKLIKNRRPSSQFTCVPILPSILTSPLHPSQIVISTDLFLSDNDPGVVIFTSGTTGPPKGSVMRRAYTFDGALAVADHYRVTASDVLLHVLPVHHATGLGIMFFPFLISGALIEFKSGSFSPEWLWDRLKRGGVTVFSGVPTIYMRMKRHFEQSIRTRSDADEYVAGARRLRACLCGTSALPKPIADFWAEVLGRKILLRYGASEIGAVFKVELNDPHVPDGSVGTISAGCDVKLSEGDSGEILVKSPEMFSKYIYDPSATAAAHTVEGYYRTGDIARREGEYYFIEGRASVDIIKSGGYKISALDIEREILGLEYVAEVMVVGIPDEEFGERVGAVLCLKDEKDLAQPPISLTLGRLRQDLKNRLAGYKMPTVLQIVEGELPKSGTGKVVKKTLGPRFFPQEYQSLKEVQMLHLMAEKAKL